MFRMLKRNDPLLQQFEIVEKENADPRLDRQSTPQPVVPTERDVLENAFDALMVNDLRFILPLAHPI